MELGQNSTFTASSHGRANTQSKKEKKTLAPPQLRSNGQFSPGDKKVDKPLNIDILDAVLAKGISQSSSKVKPVETVDAPSQEPKAKELFQLAELEFQFYGSKAEPIGYGSKSKYIDYRI